MLYFIKVSIIFINGPEIALYFLCDQGSNLNLLIKTSMRFHMFLVKMLRDLMYSSHIRVLEQRESVTSKQANFTQILQQQFLDQMLLDKPSSQVYCGPYLVVGKIEEGAQAIILLGSCNGKFYGLKVYKHGHIGRSSFQKEMKILTNLADQLVVKPLEIYPLAVTNPNHELDHKPQPFFVMQYYQNGDLRHYINSGNMPIRIRNHIIKSMVKCLQVTQSCGVLHRDIKPENFLIGDSYDLKLIDFGMGIRAGESANDLVGTPNYIAPQIYKSKDYSQKSEIFSIGVICFQLAFGRKPTFPFKEAKISDSNFLLLKQKMYDRFWAKFPANDLEPQFKKFLQKIVSAQPKDRPSLQQILEQTCLKNVASDLQCSIYFGNTKPPSKIPCNSDCMMF